MADGQLILIVGGLLAGAALGGLLADGLRVPGLLLFLCIGMALGRDGLGLVAVDDIHMAERIGVVAIALILFEGGINASVPALRRVARPTIGLALVGTLVTGLLTGAAASTLLGVGILPGLIVGATLASTDGAAVFALLRGTSLRPKLAHILEGEAGLNDPVAVLLVLGFTEWALDPQYGLADMLQLLVWQLVAGAACGGLVGTAAATLLRRVRFGTAGLYPVTSLAVAALSFGSADALGGSGFLAVYLAGLALSSSSQIPAQGMLGIFHDGLAWIAQVALFLTLGLLVAPSDLGAVAAPATALALVLMFVARPIAAALATMGCGLSVGERTLLGWAGLRGAVPIVLAMFPVVAGVPGARQLLDVTFFVVVLSTLVQGTSFERVARRLGLTRATPSMPRPLRDTGTISGLGAEVTEYRVGERDDVVGRAVRDLPMPDEALVTVIVRGNEAIPPRGDTRIATGDHLHVLVRQEAAGSLATMLDTWQHGERVYERDEVRPRLWVEAMGDPGHPVRIAGLVVTEHVRGRRDAPGALVLLEDGRYAVTGPMLVLGERLVVRRYARERLSRAIDPVHRVWWREVLQGLGG